MANNMITNRYMCLQLRPTIWAHTHDHATWSHTVRSFQQIALTALAVITRRSVAIALTWVNCV